MLWPTFTKDSDDSDDNDTNNNNLKADFELYRNGDDPELDHILEILNDDDRDVEFDSFLPKYERNVAFDFNNVRCTSKRCDFKLHRKVRTNSCFPCQCNRSELFSVILYYKVYINFNCQVLWNNYDIQVEVDKFILKLN